MDNYSLSHKSKKELLNDLLSDLFAIERETAALDEPDLNEAIQQSIAFTLRAILVKHSALRNS